MAFATAFANPPFRDLFGSRAGSGRAGSRLHVQGSDVERGAAFPPPDRPSPVEEHKDILGGDRKCRVMNALHRAYANHRGAKVRVFWQEGATKASKVEALADYAVGTLLLIPLSPTLGQNAKVPAQAVEIPETPFVDPSTGKEVKMYIAPKVEFPAGTAAGFVVPYWCVGAAESDADANMRAGTLKIEMTHKEQLVDIGGARSSLTRVSLPVLYNSKDVKSGAVLLKAASPAAEEAAKSGASASGPAPMKRARKA